jgi:hypothetical protein
MDTESLLGISWFGQSHESLLGNCNMEMEKFLEPTVEPSGGPGFSTVLLAGTGEGVVRIFDPSPSNCRRNSKKVMTT